MANRLTSEQSDQANALLEVVRKQLLDLSGGDTKLLHHLRRRIYLRLTFDERGSPTHRRKLKDQKWKEQRGKCVLCPEDLPESEAELDRLDPYGGYTRENTRLVHHACHRKQQAVRRFLGPSIPMPAFFENELLFLHQVRDQVRAKAGDKGVIERFSTRPVKLLFTSEEAKREVLERTDNPFKKAFLVSGQISTVDGEPALYKIYSVQDVIDRP